MEFSIQYGTPVAHRHAGLFLFVISHMRSFSSLLAHLLGSHPEISGYGEAQQSYAGRHDLDRLARTARTQTGEAALGRFVLDKILHNRHEIAPTILGRDDIRWVFLLRNAEDTIRSVLNMAHSLGHTGMFSDPVQVVDYYTARLARMEQYGKELGVRALYVDAQRLIDDTGPVLEGLSRALSLATPLLAEYRTFPLTGARGHGDPSPNIKAGRVVASEQERHRDWVPTAIPDDALLRATAAYHACRDALSRDCIVV